METFSFFQHFIANAIAEPPLIEAFFVAHRNAAMMQRRCNEAALKLRLT
jgi:hypothetical protein